MGMNVDNAARLVRDRSVQALAAASIEVRRRVVEQLAGGEDGGRFAAALDAKLFRKSDDAPKAVKRRQAPCAWRQRR
jgi:hypothetical protein